MNLDDFKAQHNDTLISLEDAASLIVDELDDSNETDSVIAAATAFKEARSELLQEMREAGIELEAGA